MTRNEHYMERLVLERSLAQERALADYLAQELAEARVDLEDWGAYADDYFREKWHFDADLARIDAALERYRKARK